MRRKNAHWIMPPGGFDALKIRRRHYPATNPWGFPDLLPQNFHIAIIPKLISYRDHCDDSAALARSACHFFLDDHRFESVWNQPDRALTRLRSFGYVLTPDFSLFTDWPRIVQQWNHYRSQWLGRYWQEQGLKVIPTINWSTSDSYPWAFAGIPIRQIVAISTPDPRDRITAPLFTQGYRAMLETLQPRSVWVYGKLPRELAHVEAIELPPDWHRLRRLKDKGYEDIETEPDEL